MVHSAATLKLFAANAKIMMKANHPGKNMKDSRNAKGRRWQKVTGDEFNTVSECGKKKHDKALLYQICKCL